MSMQEKAQPKKYEINKMLNFAVLQTSILPQIFWVLLKMVCSKAMHYCIHTFDPGSSIVLLIPATSPTKPWPLRRL